MARASTVKGRRNLTWGVGIRSLNPLNSFGSKGKEDDLLQCHLMGERERNGKTRKKIIILGMYGP